MFGQPLTPCSYAAYAAAFIIHRVSCMHILPCSTIEVLPAMLNELLAGTSQLVLSISAQTSDP
jgi:hypothetical protein